MDLLTFRRNAAWAWLVLAGVLTVTAQAQPKPVIVVTSAPVEQLLAKAQHLAEVARSPQLAQSAQMMLQNYTQGIDPRRPVMVVMQADEQSFQIVGLVPVADVRIWLGSTPWGAGFEDAGNGVWRGQFGQQSVFIKGAGNWAIVSNSPDGLQLPPDPLQVSGGLEAAYDFGLRVIVPNIPSGPRDLAMQRLTGMLQFSMQQQAAGAAAQRKLNEASLKKTIESIRQFLTEGESITAGLKIDPKAKTISLDSLVVPVAGTDLQRKYSTWGMGRTRVSDFFFPKATVAVSSTYRLSPEEIAQTSEQLDLAKEILIEKLAGQDPKLSEEVLQSAEALAAQIVTLAKESIAAGETDAAASAMLTDGGLAVIAASQTAAKSDTIYAVLQQSADLVRKMKLPVELKLDFHQQDGIRFHAARISLPENVDLSAAFGKKLIVYLGTAEKFMFLGIGDKSLTALRKTAVQAISNRAGKNTMPIQVVVSARQVAQLAAELTRNTQAQAVAESLTANPEGDQLRISQRIQKNGGLDIRIEIDEGILVGIGATAAPSAPVR